MSNERKQQIVADLKAGVAELQFRKLNGEVRVMRGTLRPDLLPQLAEEHVYEEGFEVTEWERNPNVVAVWDLDQKGWRSFRIDRLISIQHVNTV
jgi:hypothetical protein